MTELKERVRTIPTQICCSSLGAGLYISPSSITSVLVPPCFVDLLVSVGPAVVYFVALGYTKVVLSTSRYMHARTDQLQSWKSVPEKRWGDSRAFVEIERGS